MKNKIPYDSMSWKQFDTSCINLASKIKESKIQFDYIYGIQRGGLVVAVKLSHLLNIPMTKFFPPEEQQYNILVVDDISDSGSTLSSFTKCCKTATLHVREGTKTIPNFYAQLIKHKYYILYPWEVLE